MLKSKITTALMVLFGIIAVVANTILVSFLAFIIFTMIALYWINNTKYGARFTEFICGKEE